MCNSVKIQPHALEAITQDSAFFFDLLSIIQQHEKASLLLLSIAPLVSMFVIESHNALINMFPEVGLSFNDDHKNLLRASRHRAKLLDDSNLSLNDLTKNLVCIAEEQRQLFLSDHVGLLGRVKRFIQPDMGIFLYDGHVFSTTHTIIFGFGKNADIKTNGYDIGYAWGGYVSHLKKVLDFKSAHEVGLRLHGSVQMRDIKYESLYQRKAFGSIPLNYAMGMMLLLTSLNQIRHIIQDFSPECRMPLFRLKFLVAFHVNSNLRVMQENLVKEKVLSIEVKEMLSKSLGNKESRWLRKQKQLRNILAHYLADNSVHQELKDKATREQLISALCKDLSYGDVNILLDNFILNTSELLESAFKLLGDPFWYGKVR